MKYLTLLLSVLNILVSTHLCHGQLEIRLIAHRGGVVDSTCTENGLPALQKAAEKGYAMVEIDMRRSKDGVLLANHDSDFSRYYGFPGKVTETSWKEIRKLRSNTDGNVPLKLEDIFRFCRSKGMNVMIDNKIEGLDTNLFNQLIALLDKYGLRDDALMIGTEGSTEFFTGKIKLSCTKKQLLDNKTRADYKSGHYFLFDRPADITKEDVLWAHRENILVVAAINKYHYKGQPDMYEHAEADCLKMQRYGVRYFQIDSEFGQFLSNAH